MFTLKPPYLLMVDGAEDLEVATKTASGIIFWRKDLCLGQLKTENTRVRLDLPLLTLEKAVEKGCRSLVVGVANFGGILLPEWTPIFLDAINNGLNIISGLHQRVSDIKNVHEAAIRKGVTIVELRTNKFNATTATGRKREGKRLLTVGSDCGVGKMFTALAIAKNLQCKNIDCTFRATGQTGILISGKGLAFDALKVDYVAAAVEALTPDNKEEHWDIIEGQGSILHPVCSVVLTLLHASQPDALVMCHDISRKNLYHYPDYAVPELSECLKANLAAAQFTNPKSRFVGIALNTSRLEEEHAVNLVNELEQKHQLPCTDPIRFGVDKIVPNMLSGS